MSAIRPTDHGVEYEEDGRVPEDRGLGQLVGDEGEEGGHGLGDAQHCHHRQDGVWSPAEDEGEGQEEDLPLNIFTAHVQEGWREV